MAIVDKKGRLFGKLNLLDLAVLLVVVAVAGRFGYKYVAGRNAPAAAQGQQIEVTFKIPGVSQATINQVQPGTQLQDNQAATKPILGKVTKIETKPAIVRNIGPDGTLWESESKEVFDAYVTVLGPGNSGANTVMFGEGGGVEVKVGRTQFLISRTWAGTGTVWNIVENPPKY